MKSAIVVIDMQNGFMNDHSSSVIPKIAKVIDKFDVKIFTKFINLDKSQYERRMGWYGLKNSPEIDIVEELEDKADIIIEKNIYSCVNDGFLNYLGEKGIDKLYFVGVDTNACVMKSILDCFELDIDCYLIEDCCASHSGADFNKWAIRNIRNLVGEDFIVSSDIFK